MVAVDDAVASLSAAEAVSEKLGSALSITSSSPSAFATRNARPSPIVTDAGAGGGRHGERGRARGPPAPARATTSIWICDAGAPSVANVLNDPSAPVVPTPLGALTVPPVTLNSSRTPGCSGDHGSAISGSPSRHSERVRRARLQQTPGTPDPTSMSTRGRQIASMKRSRAVRSPGVARPGGLVAEHVHVADAGSRRAAP